MTKKLLLPVGVVVAAALLGLFATTALATHSWGPYHWARTANPFTLKLGDNVTSAWDAYLGTASSDWSQSSVLDTTVVAGGTSAKRCGATNGRVEVCNAKYGNNGWLGVASIWINSANHITRGTVKLNDTYFNTSTYNKPAWRSFVMCQEVGHTLGLDHQDEVFNNENLGSCMDYTNDPDGGPGGASETDPSNEHPNIHDFEQLELIYGHLDSSTTLNETILRGNGRNFRLDDEGLGHGLSLKITRSLYVQDLGAGERVFNFILWVD